MLWPRFIILHAHRSLLSCLGTLWSSWLSYFIRMLWIWTHLTTNCGVRVWLYAKQFQESLGLAPQTCFEISELQKNEQILWNLTWGKMPGKTRLSRSYRPLTYILVFGYNAPLKDSKTCVLSGLSRLLLSSRFSSCCITWLVNGWGHKVWQ